jgi:arylsulfatase
MAVGWTWAFDTPFKWTKQVASHFGGTRQGMAISWPGHINDPGGIRTQFHHMIDIVPTILEASGIQAPVMVNGVAQRPIEGVSMAYTFDKANANAPSTRSTQYFEMVGNRAIYHDGWLAATTPPSPPWDLGFGKFPDVVNGYTWELYNLAEDYSENNDLAAKMPDKLRSMEELFLVEAEKYDVFPLNNNFTALAVTPRPSATAGRTVFTYSGESSGLPYSGAPDITGKSYSITAEVEIPQGGAEGMINTLGGRGGGHGLYLLKGKPVFVYNFFDLERFRWEAPAALTPGKHTVVFDFKYDGPGFGKGGTGVLSVDGQEVARKTIPHTIPFVETIYETFDVGVDTRTGVDDDDYQPPFRFTGKIDKLTVTLVPLKAADAELLQKKVQETKNKAQ